MTQSGEFHRQSSILTPIPLPSLVQSTLPVELLTKEQEFRRSFRNVQGGYLGARAALGGCLEILRRNETYGPLWVRDVLSQIKVSGWTFQPLADWSEDRLLMFFRRLFRVSWSSETCARVHRVQWSSDSPELGQDDVTSLIVQEILGGKIRRGTHTDPAYGMYFLNELPGGRLFEVTREKASPTQTLSGKEVERPFLLDASKPGHEYAEAAEVPKRYRLLKDWFLVSVCAMALAGVHAPAKPESD
jgi:hypothetical protein